MFLNPDKSHFMILDDVKRTFDFIFQDNKIKYSEKEEMFENLENLEKQTKHYVTCK